MLDTSSLEKAGDTYGVIKIVPPQGWAPPLDFYASGGESVAARRFSTKAQSVNHLRKCKAFGDGKRHTVTSYARAAFKFAATQCVVVLLPALVPVQVSVLALLPVLVLVLLLFHCRFVSLAHVQHPFRRSFLCHPSAS